MINPHAYDPGNYTLTVMATTPDGTTANTTIDFEGLGPKSEETILHFIHCIAFGFSKNIE